MGVGAVLFFTPSQRESPDGMGEAVAEAINSGDNEAYRELLCRDGRDVSEYEIPVPGKVAFVGARPLHLDGGPFGEIVTLALGEDAELAVGIVKEDDQYCMWSLVPCPGDDADVMNPVSDNLCEHRRHDEG